MRFVAPVWGARYVDVFLRVGLASLLAPGNIWALPAAERHLAIYTTPAGRDRIQGSAGFAAVMEAFAEQVEFIDFRVPVPGYLRLAVAALWRAQGNEAPPPPSSAAAWAAAMISPAELLDNFAAIERFQARIGRPTTPLSRYSLVLDLLAQAHRLGAAAAAAAGDCVVFLTADVMLADGAVAELRRLADGGKKAVMACILRFDEDACLKELAACRADGEALALKPRELLRLVLRHPHVETRCFDFDSAEFGAGATSRMRWTGTGAVVNHLNWYPLMVDVSAGGGLAIDGPVDGHYVDRNFAWNDLHFVTESDRLLAVSFSPDSHYFYPRSPSRLHAVPILGRCLKRAALRRTQAGPMGNETKRRAWRLPVIFRTQ